jgi:hypothetical protein
VRAISENDLSRWGLEPAGDGPTFRDEDSVDEDSVVDALVREVRAGRLRLLPLHLIGSPGDLENIVQRIREKASDAQYVPPEEGSSNLGRPQVVLGPRGDLWIVNIWPDTSQENLEDALREVKEWQLDLRSRIVHYDHPDYDEVTQLSTPTSQTARTHARDVDLWEIQHRLARELGRKPTAREIGEEYDRLHPDDRLRVEVAHPHDPGSSVGEDSDALVRQALSRMRKRLNLT